MRSLLLVLCLFIAACKDDGCDSSRYQCIEKKNTSKSVNEFSTVCIGHILYFTDIKTMNINPMTPVIGEDLKPKICGY